MAQQTTGAIRVLDIHPLSDRVFAAVRAYIFYLYKMLLPIDLAPLYPFPKKLNLFTLEYAGSIILFFAITFFCILSLKKRKLFASVWLYYVITLLPCYWDSAGRVPGSGRQVYVSSESRVFYSPGVGRRRPL